MSDPLPVIGLTMGDPAGIGPEIIAKSLAQPGVYQTCRPICFGQSTAMRRAIERTTDDLEVHPITRIDQTAHQYGVIDVFDNDSDGSPPCAWGRISAAGGDAAFVAVHNAIEHALAGRIDAVATGPLNKEALRLAGHDFPGHTEIFAHYTKSPRYTMMLVEGTMRVAHVSTHVSLRDACDAVTHDRVLEVIELAAEACRRFGIAAPTIGVTGLNPHAGDGGMFGIEEREAIIPAIVTAKAKGVNAQGPFPADTFYPRVAAGDFDAAVAMYHDQGHIPVKLIGFRYDAEGKSWRSVNGVNITLGLPIIRTSVDHGTAFDLAGTGKASERSMLDAIECAARLASTTQGMNYADPCPR